ncbi:hypothetical protein F5Y15DRAFT_72135 [Xylariaceae sp. FL0016]|nr:hypothetical protein F5Y15DRAFT_72135 [Xylariaceae sp. FL0016]
MDWGLGGRGLEMRRDGSLRRGRWCTFYRRGYLRCWKRRSSPGLTRLHGQIRMAYPVGAVPKKCPRIFTAWLKQILLLVWVGCSLENRHDDCTYAAAIIAPCGLIRWSVMVLEVPRRPLFPLAWYRLLVRKCKTFVDAKCAQYCLLLERHTWYLCHISRWGPALSRRRRSFMITPTSSSWLLGRSEILLVSSLQERMGRVWDSGGSVDSQNTTATQRCWCW